MAIAVLGAVFNFFTHSDVVALGIAAMTEHHRGRDAVYREIEAVLFGGLVYLTYKARIGGDVLAEFEPAVLVTCHDVIAVRSVGVVVIGLFLVRPYPCQSDPDLGSVVEARLTWEYARHTAAEAVALALIDDESSPPV